MNTHNWNRIFVTLICLTLMLALTIGNVKACRTQRGETDFAAIDAYVTEQMNILGIPGMALAIVQGDERRMLAVKLKIQHSRERGLEGLLAGGSKSGAGAEQAQQLLAEIDRQLVELEPGSGAPRGCAPLSRPPWVPA